MPNKTESSSKRIDAFAQLKLAQKMLAEGRAELTSATEKIKRAQELIDVSADAIRTSGRVAQTARRR